MVRVILRLAGGAALLAIAGCGGLPWDKPLERDYHDHPLRLYVRTINQELDTIGVESCILSFEGYTYSRPGGTEGDMNWYFTFGFPATLRVQTVWPDNRWHTYAATVHHLVGYQQENGGDTSRLSAMTGGDWSMTLNVGLTDGTATLKTGEVLHTYVHSLEKCPDAVNGDSIIEINLTVDLAGYGGYVYSTPDDRSLHLNQSFMKLSRR